MKRTKLVLGVLAAAAAIGGSFALPLSPAAAQMPVFDAGNYSAEPLQAARTLEQVNNQVKSLQNEAAVLKNMARNLQTIDFPQLEKLKSTLEEIDGLMGEARAIDFKVSGLDQRIGEMFPGELQRALSSDERVSAARKRLDAATEAYRQSMIVQAGIVENVEKDAGTLSQLAAASQGAAGVLQASQAANQLIALSIKEQLQLQNLMASQFREQSIERARQAQAEEDARTTIRRFLDGPAAPAN